MTRDILILRDPRESWKKCSLAPLRGRAGVRFLGFLEGRRVEGGGRVLLAPDGPLLTPADRGRGLLLLDSSWRRLPRLRSALDGEFVARRVPPMQTAYPRRSETFADPQEGLASIEALFIATCVLGEPDFQLLEGYRFADELFQRNLELPRPPAANAS